MFITGLITTDPAPDVPITDEPVLPEVSATDVPRPPVA